MKIFFLLSSFLFFQNYFFLNFENFLPQNEEIFPQNIILSGILELEENPTKRAEELLNGWNVEIFSCGNLKVFGLDGDVSVVITPEKKYFFGESMAYGDFYDCENGKILKYSFADPANGEIFLSKEIFAENFYKNFSCEGKGGIFTELFEDGKILQKSENNENIAECEKFFSEWKRLFEK